METRNFQAVLSQDYDLAVIGGGIYGAGVAREAALQGLRVCLVERDDFGGKTSTGCFKIIHGGLRYLQQLALSRLRESAREQKILRRIAPNFVHPFPFLIPCYGSLMKSRWVLSAGLCLYELLTADRNTGLPASHRLPPFRILSQEETLALAPGIKRRGLKGGVVFYDCQLSNCERFTYSVVRSAQLAGADVLNYVEAKELVTEGTEVRYLRVHDTISGVQGEIKARQYVLAAGPWNRVLLDGERRRSFSKGVQLILPELLPKTAVAIESHESYQDNYVSRGGRSYFLVPWRGRTLVGTADYIFEGHPDTYSFKEEEVEEFWEELSRCYKIPSQITRNDVQFVWGGLRPVDKETKALEREALVCFEDTYENLTTVEGVKFTTFRATAEEVMTYLATKLNSEHSRHSRTTPLFCSDIEDFDSYLAQLRIRYEALVDERQIRRLIKNYGTEAERILELVREDPSLGVCLSPEVSTLKAEILFSAQNDMVEHLDDLVMRRTDLGTLGFPGKEAISQALKIVSREKGWDEGRSLAEQAGLEDYFFSPRAPRPEASV